MGTYTQLLYQIVFSTKHREPILIKKDRHTLYKYINGILTKKNCTPYEINGVADHLHIITHIPPSIAVSNIVKDIKLSSTEMIKENHLFPDFGGWQDGFAAFTYSIGANPSHLPPVYCTFYLQLRYRSRCTGSKTISIITSHTQVAKTYL
jgi:putative transposase